MTLWPPFPTASSLFASSWYPTFPSAGTKTKSVWSSPPASRIPVPLGWHYGRCSWDTRNGIAKSLWTTLRATESPNRGPWENAGAPGVRVSQPPEAISSRSCRWVRPLFLTGQCLKFSCLDCEDLALVDAAETRISGERLCFHHLLKAVVTWKEFIWWTGLQRTLERNHLPFKHGKFIYFIAGGGFPFRSSFISRTGQRGRVRFDIGRYALAKDLDGGRVGDGVFHVARFDPILWAVGSGRGSFFNRCLSY